MFKRFFRFLKDITTVTKLLTNFFTAFLLTIPLFKRVQVAVAA